MRPVLDIEVDESVAPAALRDSVCKWISIVGGHFHTAPILYTSASFYKKYLQGHFDAYPLWVAHYKATHPAVSTDFHIWQFSDDGRVNGIDGAVDFNVLNGDSTMLESLLLKK